MANNRRRTREPITVDLSKIATGDTRGITRSRKSRKKNKEERMFFENLVAEAYNAFLDEGEPVAVSERPAKFVEAPESEAENVRKLLRTGADHLGVGLRFGETEHLARNKVRLTFTAQHRKNMG